VSFYFPESEWLRLWLKTKVHNFTALPHFEKIPSGKAAAPSFINSRIDSAILSTMKKIVIASNSAGKLREFAELLKNFDFLAVPQSELGVSEAEEPFATFIENALTKARHASRATGLPALADDSGICVPALNGAPGVYSARYAGEPKSDARNNEKLIAAMQGMEDRRAFYYCALVLLMHPDDPHPLVAEGEWHGEIVDTPEGNSGFGYDPYFYIRTHQCTAAQLSPKIKNRVSHRGIAMRRLTDMLPLRLA
jgi:XTP/dITP diphosphohydrolase